MKKENTTLQIKQILEEHDQMQLLQFFQGLSSEEQKRFERRIGEIDWKTLDALNAPQSLNRGEIQPIDGLSLTDIKTREEEYKAAGKSALQSGKVAAVLLAGGQGTRLGTASPKGVYNIGITRPLYIFEQLVENLKTVCKDCGAYVPLLIMTSEKNDEETRSFFKEHSYFGYPKECVRFFMQSMAVCVDFNGKILLEGKGAIALSPNGNGGWYESIVRAGLMKDKLLDRVEWFNVFAVDNVLQRIADPVFIGATILSGKKSGSKVVRKTCPEEKVGVLCLEDGLPSVIEYYELTEELAHLRNERNELVYSYGVILNYLFHAKTLTHAAGELPVHIVKKKVPYMGSDGEVVNPATENAYKFETLILDLIRIMGSTLPFEVEREKEFAPIKNKTGVDSVDTARALLEANGVIL